MCRGRLDRLRRRRHKLETTSDYGDFEFEGLDKNEAFEVTVKLARCARGTFDINTDPDVVEAVALDRHKGRVVGEWWPLRQAAAV